MKLTCCCYLSGLRTSASCVETRDQVSSVPEASRQSDRCPEGVVTAAGPATAPHFIAIFAPSGHFYAFVHSFTQPAHVYIFCAILWIFKSYDFSFIFQYVLYPCFVFSITAIFVFLLIIIRFFIVSTSAVVLSIVQMMCFHAFSRTAFYLKIFVLSVLAL